MNVTSKIAVDLTRANIGARVNAVQGDGNTRYVEIALLSDGRPWSPSEGVDIAIAYYQPGGTKGLYNKLADGKPAISINGNVATVILAPQMLTASGTVQASLVFNDAQLNRLTTFPFSVSVASNPAAGAQKVEDYLRLQWLEDKLEEYLAAIKTSGVFDGKPGDNGVTFTPSVSENGDLSWSNDGGRPNPPTVNIMGPKPVNGVDYGTPEQIAGIAQQAAEILQPEVSQIKSDLTTKANQSDLDRTNSYLDALFKLNKGQTYDVLEQENEAYSVDVPSGSKFMGVDMVGGKSIIFNQLIDTSDIPTQTINGITFINNGDGSITVNGTATADVYLIIQDDVPIVNNVILMSGCPSGGSNETYRQRILDKSMVGISSDTGDGTIDSGYINAGMPYKFAVFVRNRTTVSDLVFKPQLFNLTKQFGYATRPLISNVISKYEEIGIDIVNHLHPYINGVASSQTDRIDVVSADGTISRQIETDFPALNSAGSVYDYIDLTEGKLYTWTYIEGNEVKALTEPVITDIEIHAELSDWLTVETGCSITFHNADDGKKFLIPNKETVIRKLDEVIV